jgi:hypothetical protein
MCMEILAMVCSAAGHKNKIEHYRMTAYVYDFCLFEINMIFALKFPILY